MQTAMSGTCIPWPTSTGPAGRVRIIGLAHFRQINLTLGHLNGDELLRNVAHRIAPLLGNDAHLSRTANAQFTAMLQGAHAEEASRAWRYRSRSTCRPAT